MFKRRARDPRHKRIWPCGVAGVREQAPWRKKRTFVAALNIEGIMSLMKPPDIADALAEVAVESADDQIVSQQKRPRNDTADARAAVSFENIAADLVAGKVPKLAPQAAVSEVPVVVTDDLKVQMAPLVELTPPYRLKNHQAEALAWIIQKEHTPFLGIQGGLLNIEMGGGKSLVSLSLVVSQFAEGQCATLAIMPKTLMTNYLLDIAKFFGDERLPTLIWDRSVLGDRFFDFSPHTPYKNHLVIVSYDTVLALAKSLGVLTKGKGGNAKLHLVAERFYAVPWFRVICDESHRFANHKSQLWEALMRLKPGRRLCMTGTAIRNKEDDLFAQLAFCGFNARSDPRTWTIQTYEELGLRAAVFCKSLEECNLNLPERKEMRHYVDISEFEKNVYNILMGRSVSLMDAFKAKTAQFANVLEMFTRLRQACIAPHLIAPQSKSHKLTKNEEARLADGALLGPEFIALERAIRSPAGPAGFESAKMREMVRIIRAIPPNEKVIVFCEWATAVHLATAVLAAQFGAESVEMVDGETDDRDESFARFRLDSNVRFLACTGVAAHGLTLIEANHIILLGTSFTSYLKDQAAARIWRIGQTRPVFIWELIVKGSIESKMLQIMEAKHNIRDIMLESGLNSEVIAEFLGDLMPTGGAGGQ